MLWNEKNKQELKNQNLVRSSYQPDETGGRCIQCEAARWVEWYEDKDTGKNLTKVVWGMCNH